MKKKLAKLQNHEELCLVTADSVAGRYEMNTEQNGKHCVGTVSYTHLDVYKRQV